MLHDPAAEAVIAQAKKEVDEERFRARVEQEKVRLRQRRTWGDRLFGWFPYTIERKK